MTVAQEVRGPTCHISKREKDCLAATSQAMVNIGREVTSDELPSSSANGEL
jgi:hypothetical protein